MLQKSYQLENRKRKWILLAIAAIGIISLFVDVLTGSADLSVMEIMNAIFMPDRVSGNIRVIVMGYRLPIALMAVTIGMALGTAGNVMQTILHNPLASPYTLGIGAAAGFGASLAIIMGWGNIGISISSFVFSLSVSMIISSYGRRSDTGSNTLVLLGIAILFLFQSLQALLQYGASETQNQSIVFWSFGSLQRTTWQSLLITLAVTCICIPLFFRNSWKYTALQMGDQRAEALGIDVKNLKMNSFILVAVLAAVSVCFTGSIGFIGLAGPHIARMLVSDNSRYSLPASALCGGVLLSFASIISKVIRPGLIFPIGIITSIIGVPFFLILLRKQRRGL